HEGRLQEVDLLDGHREDPSAMAARAVADDREVERIGVVVERKVRPWITLFDLDLQITGSRLLRPVSSRQRHRSEGKADSGRGKQEGFNGMLQRGRLAPIGDPAVSLVRRAAYALVYLPVGTRAIA